MPNAGELPRLRVTSWTSLRTAMGFSIHRLADRTSSSASSTSTSPAGADRPFCRVAIRWAVTLTGLGYTPSWSASPDGPRHHGRPATSPARPGLDGELATRAVCDTRSQAGSPLTPDRLPTD